MLKSIDILIGLTVVMLMISMLVTALTGAINTLVNLRGRQLLRGLAQMIGQISPELPEAAADGIARAVLLHPLIRGSNLTLAPPFGSVIHREELSKILMELATPDATHRVSAELAAPLRDLLRSNGIDNPAVALAQVRKLALDFEKARPELAHNVRQNLALVHGTASDLVAKINGAFDQTMDRISERFTTLTRGVTLVCALSVVLVSQLDTLSLVNRLAMDDTLREGLSKQAQTMSAPAAGEDAKAAALKYRQFLDSRGLVTVPASWQAWIDGWSLINPFGMLLSVFLLNLGAPFWYEALKNLLNLRSTIAAKDDAQRSDRESIGSTSKTAEAARGAAAGEGESKA